MNVFERFREAFRVFRGRDRPLNPISNQYPFELGNPGWYGGVSSADRPDRFSSRHNGEQSIVDAILTKIALDVAGVQIHHVKVDENGTYQDTIKDSLEELFTVEANIDQSYHSYMVDLVRNLFDEGVVAEVPVDMDVDEDPQTLENVKVNAIYELRVGRIVEWRPREIQVECYDEERGLKEQVTMAKRECSIIENPFYGVMNEKNSVFKRLSRKLRVLDAVDNNYDSDKLNMIFQLPYLVRGEAKKQEARNRMAELEADLRDSPHGIAFIDGTEKVIQLNRPIENNLQAQVEWLTNLGYAQLGMTPEIMNGTADEKTMANYMNRVVGTVLDAICAERRRKWLTKEQRDNGESIIYIQDPLKLVPVTNLADIFDKLGRNAIISPNESRGKLGFKPSKDPESNKLINRNMPIDKTPGTEGEERQEEEKLPELEHSEFRRVKVKARRVPVIGITREPKEHREQAAGGRSFLCEVKP